MRTLILKDKLIEEEKYAKLIEEYTAFLKTVGIKDPVFWSEERDFSIYPVEADLDDDARPAKAWLTGLIDKVHLTYHEFGVDHVVLLVHENNWRSAGGLYRTWLKKRGLFDSEIMTKRGIWGTNMSYVYRTYQVQYCRWDKGNPANSFGTLNHEQDHSYDSLCQVETGVDLRKILGVTNYDKYTTHGGRPGDEANGLHGYIRYKENEKKLKKIAPYLNAAYGVRRARHAEHIQGLQLKLIGVAQHLIYLLRARLNQKNGVKK